MQQRVLNIEFKDFPEFPPRNLNEKNSNSYLKKIEIDLFKLSNLYKIEEFSDYNPSISFEEFPALRYLISNTNLFKFRSGQPGSSKDSRKENSRVLGQTFCRYFNYYFLDAVYTAHVSNFIGKQLGSEFNNVRIERKCDGDTPDFISAKNDSTIFLSEAKGRRKEIPFEHEDFSKWRKQFDRISIYENLIEISLKGYIIELAIANENNGLYNSKLFIEDPKTSGETFKSNLNLYNLIKCGHYFELLEKLGYGYIGQSLIYKQKLDRINLKIPIFISKITNKEYIGNFDRLGIYPILDDFRILHKRDMLRFARYNSSVFYGLDRNIFENIVKIAKGQSNLIQEIYPKQKEYIFNELVMEFKDSSMLCDPSLITFKGFMEF